MLQIANEWAYLTHAPVLSITAAIAIGTGLWIVLHFVYKARFENLEGRLKLRDDEISDYKNKLAGATPDEAKTRIDTLQSNVERLEKLIADVTPRGMTSDQMRALSDAVRGFNGVPIDVGRDMAISDGQRLAGQIGAAFESAGWQVRYPGVMGLGNPPRTGLALQVANPASLNAAERAADAGLRASGLTYEIQQAPPQHPLAAANVIIMVAAKL